MNKEVTVILQWTISSIAVVLLYFFAVYAVRRGRKKFEGMAYNVSRASKYGVGALCVIFWIAITIMQTPGIVWPHWPSGVAMHVGLVLIFAAFATGFVMLYLRPPREVMDVYHNVVVVPVLLWLFILSVLVIQLNATKIEAMLAILGFSVWLLFFVWDASQGRLNQREWIKKHDPDLDYFLR